MKWEARRKHREAMKAYWAERKAKEAEAAAQVSQMPVAEVQAELNAQLNARVDAVNVAVAPEVLPYEKPDPNDPRMARLRMRQQAMIASDPTLQRRAQEEAAVVVAEPVEVVEPPEVLQKDLKRDIPRLDAELPEPGRVRVTEYVIRVRSDGTMVSETGPCLCGAGKRVWHGICLKRGEA